MKCVHLACRDEWQGEAMSPRERDDFEAARRASEQDLRQSHHLFDFETLQSDTALTVRLVPVLKTEQCTA